MNIMLLGKYPPIQGGESRKAYWLSKYLGSRGHKICVVSNCLEVEENYKCILTEEDKDMLQPKNVTLKSTYPVRLPKFIPQNNPFSEKLTSIALDAAEEFKPDLIFSWYLLPYAVAGFNLSKILGKKHLIHHAGSDITRLFHYPYLNSFLSEVIKNADGILTYTPSKKFFEKLRVKKTFINLNAFPPEFNPNDSNANLQNKLGVEINNKSLLFLGKLSKQKGIEYLIDSFSEIGINSQLFIAGGGDFKYAIEYKISNGNLNNVYLLGNLPTWKIPSLIRSVHAVVVPEYNFGVSAHRSGIPFESLLCGRTPLISTQIALKYGQLSDFFVKINPIDKSGLTRILEEILENEALNNKIIEENNNIKKLIGDFDDYINNFESIFNELVS